jgi:hypothetical protein
MENNKEMRVGLGFRVGSFISWAVASLLALICLVQYMEALDDAGEGSPRILWLLLCGVVVFWLAPYLPRMLMHWHRKIMQLT